MLPCVLVTAFAILRSCRPASLLLILFTALSLRAAEHLTTVQAIRALSRIDAAKEQPVHLRGVVTFAYGREGTGFMIQDASAGIYINISKQTAVAGPFVAAAGMDLEIDGVTEAGRYAPIVNANTISVVGLAPLPPAQTVPFAELLTGQWDSQRVALRGIVRAAEIKPESAEKLRLQIGVPGGRIATFCVEGGPADQKRLIDAEVIVTGVCITFFNLRSESVGVRLQLNKVDEIQVLKAAPLDPFALPETNIEEILAFSSDRPASHRVRVSGVVTLARPGAYFYLQSGNRGVRVETQDSATPVQAGDAVEAAGFPGMTGSFGELEESVFRRTGSGVLPKSHPAHWKQIVVPIYSAGSAPDFDGTRVNLQGRLESLESTGPEGPRLFIAHEGHTITAQFGSDAAAEIERLKRGSELQVTGICVVESAAVWPARDYPSATGFHLLVSSMRDLEILALPPWWTPARLWSLLGIIGGGLVAALLWAALLQHRIARSALRLQTEIQARHDARVEFDATLRERQRMATDLHDTLEQALTVLALHLEAAGKFESIDPERASGQIKLAKQFLASCRQDVRRSVWNLRSQSLDGRNFPDALRDLARLELGNKDVAIGVQTHGEPTPVPELIASNLLLLAREAITNALKHAAPTEIRIDLTFEKNNVVLAIENDGRGFDPDRCEGPETGHFGLLGMKERMKRLGGTLVIQSAPESGARIIGRAPLSAPDRVGPA